LGAGVRIDAMMGSLPHFVEVTILTDTGRVYHTLCLGLPQLGIFTMLQRL